jgi:dual specificity phosphatase 12
VQVTGFDIPHSFPQDFVPVFGMDVRSCLEYYMEAFSLTEEFKSKHDALSDNDPHGEDWIVELAARTAAAKVQHYESITSEGIEPIQGAAQLMRDSCLACVHPITRQTLVAIASSGSHAKIKHNLSSANLWGIIPKEKIVSAEEVAKGKPYPDVYLKALERLDCTTPAQSAIVIEDSVHGIHAAFRAQVGKIVAITTSLNHKEMKEALVSLRQRETIDDQQNLPTDTESRIHLSPTCAVTIIGSTLPETYNALIDVLQ